MPRTANENRALKGVAIDALAARGYDGTASDSGDNVISVLVTKTQFETMRTQGIDARYRRMVAGKYWVFLTLTQHNCQALGI